MSVVMYEHVYIAHSLALADFGRSVVLNPERSANFFLRGDCQSKLGNYEQVRESRVCFQS